MKREQELEAPPAVLALVHGAAQRLGANAELAAEAARTGVFEMHSRSVSVVLAPDENNLVLSTPLSAEWVSDAACRKQALKASVTLLLQAGVAFCITPAGAALMSRWSLDRPDAGLLAAWVQQFALMANLIAAGTPVVAGRTEGLKS